MQFGVEKMRSICCLKCLSKSDYSFDLITSTLGTPTEEVWPGVTKLRYFNKEFPKWPRRSIKKSVPQLDPLAEDLLNVSVFQKLSNE